MSKLAVVGRRYSYIVEFPAYYTRTKHTCARGNRAKWVSSFLHLISSNRAPNCTPVPRQGCIMQILTLAQFFQRSVHHWYPTTQESSRNHAKIANFDLSIRNMDLRPNASIPLHPRHDPSRQYPVFTPISPALCLSLTPILHDPSIRTDVNSVLFSPSSSRRRDDGGVAAASAVS